MQLRNVFLFLGALVVLATVNVLAYQREDLQANGRVMYLELAPVDPRSLVQGDYMRLRYALANNIPTDAGRDGVAVVQLDERNIAHSPRNYNPQQPLAAQEMLLQYHWRENGVVIGPESFFFQEGHAQYYRNARYAELRVSPSGEVSLIGLRGENLELLGPP